MNTPHHNHTPNSTPLSDEAQSTRVLEPPFTDATLRSLKAGDMVYISGTIYTARDAAHKR